MTSVFDMKTGTYTDYTLSPFDAVVAAYAQREKNEYNTWLYQVYHDRVTVCDSCTNGVVVVTCGNQSALAAKGKEREYHNHDYEVERG